MKQLQTIVLALAAALLTATFATTLYAAEKAPEKPIVIKACQEKKPPVTFSHQEHFAAFKKGNIEYTCKTCHHTGDVSKPCTACHKNPTNPNVPNCTEMSMTKNPFHIKCIGCHKKVKSEFPKAPTSCTQGHKKTS